MDVDSCIEWKDAVEVPIKNISSKCLVETLALNILTCLTSRGLTHIRLVSHLFCRKVAVVFILLLLP